MKAAGNLGKKARLISSVFRATGSNCELRLFFHLFGDHIGSLAVYSRTTIGGGERQLFNRTREVGDFWDRARVPIKETDPFQIVIEGVVGSGIFGDIGLDDLSFTSDCKRDDSEISTISTTPSSTTSGICNAESFKCKTTNDCIPLDKVCNFNYECADKSDEENCGTCDFESSQCGWYMSDGDRYEWLRRQAPSALQSGPQLDHTLGQQPGAVTKGYYMIATLADEDGSFLGRPTLMGPPLQATSSQCKLTMWIYMGGVIKSDFNVYMQHV